MTPEISIVLPTYNGAGFIGQSIDSCLNQSFRNFELIIVNDCSTDSTADIINAYAAKDSRIKLIHNERNLRLPLSLNKGFDAAKGKYFTWTSDDNLYAPFALELMFEELEKDPSPGVVYTDYSLIDNNGAVFGARVFNNVYESFHRWIGAGACFLYHAEVHRQLKGYDPSLFLIEDYDFFVRAFTKFKFRYLPRTDTYFYREHPASLTGTYGSSRHFISKVAIEKLIPDLKKVLPPHEMALLYRKLAVFAGVYKNDVGHMQHFMKKLAGISKKQLFITSAYIALKKSADTIKVSVAAFFQAVKFFFKA